MTNRAMLAVMAVLLQSGCATIDSRWDTCERGAGTFVQLADCTLRAVQAARKVLMSVLDGSAKA